MHLEFPGKRNQPIRFTAHGGNHHHNLLATRLKSGYATSDIFYALGAAHRCTTVFLNNKGHDYRTFFYTQNIDFKQANDPNNESTCLWLLERLAARMRMAKSTLGNLACN